MTLLFNYNCNNLIDHSDYVSKLYKNIVIKNKTKCFTLSTKLFCIKNNEMTINRKRRRDADNLHKEAITVRNMYLEILENIPSHLKDCLNNKYNMSDTITVRDYARDLFESNMFDHVGLNGGNNSENPLLCEIKDEKFLLPQKSRFFCGDVKEQCEKLSNNKYDIIIADPPWWNKYIRRLKGANNKLSYSMMYNEDIASIPIKDLHLTNCLIAVWCTNAPSNVDAVKNVIFPKWGVEYVTTWYWLKVTINLKPLCDFGTGCKKQPYERLILGKVGELKKVPDSMLFMSIPSALHSHKPPLLDLLSPYVNVEAPQALELFARYLLPNTTSIGYEPLKWQHISLYDVT